MNFEHVGILRFAVGSDGGPRSAVWRIWGNKKGDIYVASRSLGGVLKTSLHRDRRCNTGFTTSYHDRPGSLSPKGRSRHLDRWSLPDVPAVLAAEILIPGTELRAAPVRGAEKVKWLTAPRPDQLLVASVVLVRSGAPPVDWNELGPGLEPLGVVRTELRSACVVHKTIPMSAAIRSRVKQEIAHASQTIKEPRRTGYRLQLLGQRGDRVPRQFMDLAWQD